MKIGDIIFITKKKKKGGYNQKSAIVTGLYKNFFTIKFENYSTTINLSDIRTGIITITKNKIKKGIKA